LAGAVAAFQRAVELNPDFEDAHYNLGLALRARGKTDAAQKEMSEIRGLHEFRARLAQAKLLILQGVGALKEQRFDDALASFQQSIEKGPELPTGNYYLGLTWERKDDAEQALAAYEKALELKPDYAQAHSSLATVLAPERSRARWRSSTKRSCAIPISPRRITISGGAGTIRNSRRSRSRTE
jgi:superkiller protein 3